MYQVSQFGFGMSYQVEGRGVAVLVDLTIRYQAKRVSFTLNVERDPKSNNFQNLKNFRIFTKVNKFC